LTLSPLFLINWLHGTHLNTRIEHLLFFQGLVIVVTVLSLPNRWLRYFGCWSVLTFYITGLHMYTLGALSLVFLGMLWMLLLYKYNIKHDKILKTIGISGIIVSLSVIAQINVLHILPLTIGNYTICMPITCLGVPKAGFNLEYNALAGLINQPNLSGAYLAICLPIFMVYFKRFLGVAIVALLLTKCNGAIIACAVGVMFFYTFRPDRRLKDIIICCLVCLSAGIGFCFLDKPDTGTRLLAAKTILNQTNNWHIITGYGLDSFKNVFKVFIEPGRHIGTAHNEYLQIYCELGIVGLGLVLFYIKGLFKGFFDNFKYRTEDSVLTASCCVVVLVVSMFSFNFHYAYTAMIGLVLFVLMDKQKGGSYGNDKEG